MNFKSEDQKRWAAAGAAGAAGRHCRVGAGAAIFGLVVVGQIGRAFSGGKRSYLYFAQIRPLGFVFRALVYF